MTTQNNRLTPVLSNNLVQSDGVTKTQKQTIFENMSDGIITVTADGLINYVNSAATQIFDLSEESLVGQSFAKTRHLTDCSKNVPKRTALPPKKR